MQEEEFKTELIKRILKPTDDPRRELFKRTEPLTEDEKEELNKIYREAENYENTRVVFWSYPSYMGVSFSVVGTRFGEAIENQLTKQWIRIRRSPEDTKTLKMVANDPKFWLDMEARGLVPKGWVFWNGIKTVKKYHETGDMTDLAAYVMVKVCQLDYHSE